MSAGWNVVAFESPRFLEGFVRATCSCLVLDLAMPGIGGLDLQRMLEPEARIAHRISHRPW
jgi:FixJ family two-component response regulator